MVIIIDNYAVNIEKDNLCFKIKKEEEIRIIHPQQVTAIHIYKPCFISSSAILLAAENEIPILFMNTIAQCKALLWQTKFGSISSIRKQQYHFTESKYAIEWIVNNFKLKLNGQINNLQALENNSKEWNKIITPTKQKLYDLQKTFSNIPAPSLQQSIRYEAHTSKLYWNALKQISSGIFAFDKRSKHPAKDNFNCLLNYGYGMLYNIIYNTTITAGLDPYLGIQHVDEHNTPSFTFDAIEPYRPWIDRLVLNIATKNLLNNTHFTSENNAILLHKEGKKIFIPMFEEYMHEATLFNHKRIKRKDQIQYHLTNLAQQLLKQYKQNKKNAKANNV
jgi:CRISPR-associated protein Cas1